MRHISKTDQLRQGRVTKHMVLILAASTVLAILAMATTAAAFMAS